MEGLASLVRVVIFSAQKAEIVAATQTRFLGSKYATKCFCDRYSALDLAVELTALPQTP